MSTNDKQPVKITAYQVLEYQASRLTGRLIHDARYSAAELTKFWEALSRGERPKAPSAESLMRLIEDYATLVAQLDAVKTMRDAEAHNDAKAEAP